MKRKIALFLVAMMTVTSMTGCSLFKKTSSKEEANDQSDLSKTVYEEAVKNINELEFKAMDVTQANSYDNEMEEVEEYRCIYDAKKGVVERYNNDETEGSQSFQYFNIKEGDGTYSVLVLNEMTAYDWVGYTETLDEGDVSQYEEHVNSFDPSFSEKQGYQNITFEKETEETLNDVACYKITLHAELPYGTSSKDPGENYTREDVLSDYEITEDAVALVDGFSDIIDNYVKAVNGAGSEGVYRYTQTAWITKDDHQFVKVETVNDLEQGEQSVDGDQALQMFLDNSYKVEMAQGYLNDGMSKEEAKKKIDQEIADIEGTGEESDDGEISDASVDSDDNYYMFADASITKEVVTKEYLLGENAPELDGVPEQVSTTSQDEFFEEYE